MQTWNDTCYNLDESDALTICNHVETSATISLSLPGYYNGRGFSIHFTTAQIEAIAKLLIELQDLKVLEERANKQLQLEDEQGKDLAA